MAPSTTTQKNLLIVVMRRLPSPRNSPSRPYRLTSGLLVLVTFLAFILRVTSLDAQSLWRDEVDALCYAFRFPQALEQALAPQVASAAELPIACPPLPMGSQEGVNQPLATRLASVARTMIRQNGPLYFFLLRGWIALAGYSVTALRFFSLWFGVLAVPLTYVLGRRLLGRASGVFAALLSAASAYLTWYGQEVKMYTLVPALALLAVYALRRAVEGGGARWWVVQVVATSLALYIHIWSALLIPVQLVLFLSWGPQSGRHWVGGLISLALLTLPYLPLARWQMRYVFVSRETGFPHYTLRQMVTALLVGWSTGTFGQGWPWGGIACGTGALLGLTTTLWWDRPKVRKALEFLRLRWRLAIGADVWARTVLSPGAAGSRIRVLLGLVSWVLLPVLGIWFVSQWQPLFTDRYLIWAAPAFYLLVGAGLAFLWTRGRWPALPLLVAIFLIFGGNLRYQAQVPIKSDFRAAAAFVEDRYEREDLLLFQIPHGRYTFDYYFGPAGYAAAEGLYTNHRREDGSYQMTKDQAAAEMEHLTHMHERVWLIATETPMWDERHLVVEWLATHGTQVLVEHFARVDVLLYELPPAP
ncbi:MAG: glycosyltransferase family 39 protein [Anaerolineae bacterium]